MIEISLMQLYVVTFTKLVGMNARDTTLTLTDQALHTLLGFE